MFVVDGKLFAHGMQFEVDEHFWILFTLVMGFVVITGAIGHFLEKRK